MPPFPPPSHSPLAITLVIAVAALIALGMLLRWQQDRQRLMVLKLAIEKGVTFWPNSVPMWLNSLRQGIMLATLGVALLIVGGIAVTMAPSGSMREPGRPRMMQPLNGMGVGPAIMPNERPNRFPPPYWQRQKMLGMSALAIGFILTLLGMVRIGFAVVERKYFTNDENISSDFPHTPSAP